MPRWFERPKDVPMWIIGMGFLTYGASNVESSWWIAVAVGAWLAGAAHYRAAAPPSEGADDE